MGEERERRGIGREREEKERSYRGRGQAPLRCSSATNFVRTPSHLSSRALRANWEVEDPAGEREKRERAKY